MAWKVLSILVIPTQCTYLKIIAQSVIVNCRAMHMSTLIKKMDIIICMCSSVEYALIIGAVIIIMLMHATGVYIYFCNVINLLTYKKTLYMQQYL